MRIHCVIDCDGYRGANESGVNYCLTQSSQLDQLKVLPYDADNIVKENVVVVALFCLRGVILIVAIRRGAKLYTKSNSSAVQKMLDYDGYAPQRQPRRWGQCRHLRRLQQESEGALF